MCDVQINNVFKKKNSDVQIRVVWKDRNEIFGIPCNGREKDDQKIEQPYPISRKSFENAIDNGEWFLNRDPYDQYDASRATDKNRNRRDTEYSIIRTNWDESKEALLYQADPKAFYDDLSRDLDCSVVTAKRKMNRFLKGGMTPDSLLSRTTKSGGRGKQRVGKIRHKREGVHTITDQELDFAKRWLDDNYMNGKGSKKTHQQTKTYEKYKKAYRDNFHPDDYCDVMSLKQFRTVIRAFYSPDDITQAGMEDYEYAANHRILTGSAMDRGLGYAGMEAVTDSTVLDLYIRSESGGILERPVLTSLMCQQTGAILAINVTLGAPTAHDFIDCLMCANMDKMEFAKQFDVEGFNTDAWPFKGLPQSILMDNGELRSQELVDRLSEFGIEVSFAEACRGDQKSRIERWHKTLNDHIHECPGAVNRDSRIDDRPNATLTLKDLWKILIYIVQYYNFTNGETNNLTPEMIKQGVGDNPVERYRYYQEAGHDVLKSWHPMELRKKLYFRKNCSVDRYGVTISKLHYTSKDPDVQDYFKALIAKKQKALIAYGTKTDDIWLVYQKNAELSERLYKLELNTAQEDWAGLTDAEVEALRKMEKENRGKADKDMMKARDTIMGHIIEIQNIPVHKPDPTKSKAQQIAEIPENTKRERQEEGYIDAFDGRGVTAVTGDDIDEEAPDEYMEDGFLEFLDSQEDDK